MLMIHAYDYFNKLNHFSLTFHFLTPKERDLHCSHEVMLQTKQAHKYTFYKFIQHHYTLNTPAREVKGVTYMRRIFPHISAYLG